MELPKNQRGTGNAMLPVLSDLGISKTRLARAPPEKARQLLPSFRRRQACLARARVEWSIRRKRLRLRHFARAGKKSESHLFWHFLAFWKIC